MRNTFYLGDDNIWHRRGATDVRPGEPPPPIQPPPTAGSALQIYDLKFVASGTVNPNPVPPPIVVVAGKTYCGACLTNGAGGGLAGASTVPSKWGNRAAVRMFQGDNPITSGPWHPATASLVHTSWNLVDSTVNSGSLDDAIAAMAQRTPNGDVVEHKHESDNDKLSAAAITARIKAKNRIYDIVKATKPGVLVAHTTTGGFWYNSTGDTARDVWMATAKGDLIGYDYDGVHDKDDAGPDYDVAAPTTSIANIKRYLSKYKANGWQGFTVPEFGTSRRPWDTTGQPRADWFAAGADELIKAGAYMICAFDYDTPTTANGPGHHYADDYNVLKVGTPEYTTWRKYVAANP